MFQYVEIEVEIMLELLIAAVPFNSIVFQRLLSIYHWAQCMVLSRSSNQTH